MFILKKKLSLKTWEDRLIKKINFSKHYKAFLSLIFSIFWFKKIYYILKWGKSKSNLWAVSLTSDNMFWKKVSYIDDFIVSDKSRWKWIWKKIFQNVLSESENKENSDYTFLVTDKSRKVSHSLYKKFWFTLIGMWVWYLAYKINKKNKWKKY